jgi:glutamate synthase domain-containing protein 3
VCRHIALTGSAHASHLLFRWAEMRARWIKVMPRDYKRVLRAEAEAQKAGKTLAFDELVGAANG